MIDALGCWANMVSVGTMVGVRHSKKRASGRVVPFLIVSIRDDSDRRSGLYRMMPIGRSRTWPRDARSLLEVAGGIRGKRCPDPRG